MCVCETDLPNPSKHLLICPAVWLFLFYLNSRLMKMQEIIQSIPSKGLEDKAQTNPVINDDTKTPEIVRG